jgi:hypothetical protein
VLDRFVQMQQSADVVPVMRMLNAEMISSKRGAVENYLLALSSFDEI